MSWEKRAVDEEIENENRITGGFLKTTSYEDTCPECGTQLWEHWYENEHGEEVSQYECHACGWNDYD